MTGRKLCSAPGCDDLAEIGDTRCAQHRAEAMARQAASRARAQTSDHAARWRELYNDPRWRRAAKQFLQRHPLCADCGALGLVEAATEVDHIRRHLGDRRIFWDRTNWQPLCKRCHSRKTAREVFATTGGGQWSIPFRLRPSRIPVEVVAGPPGGGKSHYIAAQARPGEIVIDLDRILADLGGRRWDQRPELVKRAFAQRDRMLLGLATSYAPKAWLQVSAPDPAERAAWQAALGPKASVTLICPPLAVTLAQIDADPGRATLRQTMRHAAEAWYGQAPRGVSGNPGARQDTGEGR